jgi:hypothetical protein
MFIIKKGKGRGRRKKGHQAKEGFFDPHGGFWG